MAPWLTVSIVVYRTPLDTLGATLDSLAQAADSAKRYGVVGGVGVVLVDNGESSDPENCLWSLLCRPAYRAFDRFTLFHGQGNVGYGMGHNRVLAANPADFFLVLNPDVVLSSDALTKGLRFMVAHPDAGLLAPRVEDERGERQYLCKRYPSVLALLLRAFAPARMRRYFVGLLDHYEMRDLMVVDQTVWDFPIASGCFMLLRAPLVRKIGGFSPRFFLYFEDFDLSLRLIRVGRTVYVPAVRIVHLGGYAARKGWRHIFWFSRSMVRFFGRHGWCWY